jgi:hypothetical protein
MKTKKEEGVSAKDMDLKQLKALAVQLELFTAEEVASMKKAPLLKAITAWEDKAIEASKDASTGLKKLGGNKVPETVLETVEEDMYEGKKVISRTTREINGKKYEDVLVVTGETFTNPIAI